MISVQELAFAVIAIAAGVIAFVSVLIVRRVSRLVDAAMETVCILNRLAPRVEALVAAAEAEVATVRAITARFARVSERVGALSEDVVQTLETLLDPVKRVSKTIGALKALIAEVVGGGNSRSPRTGAGVGDAEETSAEDALPSEG